MIGQPDLDAPNAAQHVLVAGCPVYELPEPAERMAFCWSVVPEIHLQGGRGRAHERVDVVGQFLRPGRCDLGSQKRVYQRRFAGFDPADHRYPHGLGQGASRYGERLGQLLQRSAAERGECLVKSTIGTVQQRHQVTTEESCAAVNWLAKAVARSRSPHSSLNESRTSAIRADSPGPACSATVAADTELSRSRISRS